MSKPVYDSMPVEDFIRKYGKPYDPAMDNYDRSPFIADIKEGKNDPIYNAHSYHTKVPPRAIIPYILHYTEPGDIVLDPFCGSGMTGVAALLCERPPKELVETAQRMNPDREIKAGARRAILNDLSPAACHIAYNYCNPVDTDELKKVIPSFLSSSGPSFLEVKVNTDSRSDLGRPTSTPKENKEEFMENLINN